MPKRVTHSDIAKQLDCDKSTVSLALRGSPRISEKTRKRVAAEAKRMGYRPDPTISLLARQRWIGHHSGQGATIAYLVESKSPQYRIQCRHMAAARKAAEARGYSFGEFDLSEYPSGKSASRVLHHRGIRGLIIPAIERQEWEFMESFAWEKFTVVNCSVGWMKAPFYTVRPDVFEGVRLAWNEVWRRGYRKIGAALNRHNPVADDDNARLGGSLVEQQSLLSDEKERIPFLLSPPLDREAFLEWFETHRPEVIISFISTALTWLEEAGYSVPRDVAFASLNAMEGAPASGVSVQIDEVACSSVDFLIAQMHENRWGIPESQIVYMLEPKWVEGTTLPDRSDA